MSYFERHGFGAGAGLFARNGNGEVKAESAVTEPNLEFIGTQLERLTGDVAGLREDMAVLTSIVLRQDATLTALSTALRAMHSRIARVADRGRRPESQD